MHKMPGACPKILGRLSQSTELAIMSNGTLRAFSPASKQDKVLHKPSFNASPSLAVATGAGWAAQGF